ncbi:hypothetical protein POM88_000863 [Heracleum sosnowskyi]|uniref:DUF627 domain-containing protein n=1 Tax=Heracleum sosnowskyi TaxID=360622 RepID=A0AAD8JCD4_9APIA|nr:hypothetical protein POM88_000863 [Heracleum sosnowskyi]
MKALCGDIKSVIDLGLVYGVQGTFCFMATSIIDDVGMKEKYLRNANESAKKATVLSPNSVEYAHFYAKLLCEAAKEYDEVAKEWLVYHFQGTICFKAALIIDGVIMKEKYVMNAIESANKATMLSPNSVEYAHFNTKLLCEETNEYDEVVKECEHALGVENLVDPTS